MSEKLYLYELMDNGTPEAYDEAMAVACMQGLINRAGAYLYVTCPDDDAHRNGQIGDTQWGPQLKRPRCTPRYWLDIFTAPGEWLSGREQVWLHGLQEVYELTKPYIKGAVIWDTEVPGTVNVATTIAGVEDLIVMSPELYLSFGIKMGIPVAKDLRGKFDGSETGSRRCDAYRWAVREYIDTGKCTSTVIGQYLDAWRTRDIGLTSYVLERDRMVAERAFVFDLNLGYLCAFE